MTNQKAVHIKVKDIQNSLREENKVLKRLAIVLVYWVWHGQGTKLNPLIIISEVKSLLLIFREVNKVSEEFSLGRRRT